VSLQDVGTVIVDVTEAEEKRGPGAEEGLALEIAGRGRCEEQDGLGTVGYGTLETKADAARTDAYAETERERSEPV
jgi:hypothetical protein